MKFARLINFVLVVVISAGVAFWSFSAFDDGLEMTSTGWEVSEGVLFGEIFEANGDEVLRLNGRDTVVIFDGAELQLNWYEGSDWLTIDLEKGGVLLATYAGDAVVEVETDFARVDGGNGLVYVDASGSGAAAELQVYSLDHPNLVTFTQEVDGSVEDLNSIYVPGAYRMKIASSKVSDTTGLLRLTKLSKEFPVYEIEDDDLPGGLDGHVADIESVYTADALAFVSEVRDAAELGPSTDGFAGQVNDLYGSFQETFTFMPHAELKLDAEAAAAYLAYAITNYVYEDFEAGSYWLSEWEALALGSDAMANGDGYEMLADLYEDLFWVLPGDDLYEVKAAVADVLFADAFGGGDVTLTLESLRRQYHEIETLLSDGEKVRAQEAYNEYKADFQEVLDGSLGAEWLSEINREYLLLELLLRSNVAFYSAEDVELLVDLEEEILQLAGEDLDEERQAFVQSKIRFLANLFDFVEEGRLSVEVAAELAEDLIDEAELYLASLSSETAVQGYFEIQLEEYDVAADFMESAEFYAYEDFDEGLAAYKEKLSDLGNLTEYIQNIRLGSAEGAEAELTLEEAKDEVAIALLYAGLQYSEIVHLEDAYYRLFEIRGARAGEYELEANYDRETGILYDVEVGDFRFSTGLILENARDVIEQAMEDAAEEEDAEEESAADEAEGASDDDGGSSSLTESLAVSRAQEAFEAVGLDPDDFEIVVTDVGADLFSFEGVIEAGSGGGQLPVYGTFDLVTGQVSEILWEMDGQVQYLPDLALEQMEAAILATYEALQGA
jgi:hypothetical protein